METATVDRLKDPAWWPTKADVPLEAFAGQRSCAQCHAAQLASQPTTPMGRAATRATSWRPAAITGGFAFNDGSHHISITRKDLDGTADPSYRYAIDDGTNTVAEPLEWVFGSGQLGQTFLYQDEGRWHESQVSLYTRLSALDLTTGHSPRADAALHEALGQALKPEDAQQCFRCHTTYATDRGRFDPQHAMPGLGCEACHGPGRAHRDSMESAAKAQSTHAAQNETLGLPIAVGQLSPVDSVDFCGACHRTWADVAFTLPVRHTVDTVRFQPYRLEKSKCWGTSGDSRITCVACHDPHQPLETNVASYDRRCLACHAAAEPAAIHSATASATTNPAASAAKNSTAARPVKRCPVSQTGCVTCHMPRIPLASMHGEFTDHWIRIVRAGEVFPN